MIRPLSLALLVAPLALSCRAAKGPPGEPAATPAPSAPPPVTEASSEPSSPTRPAPARLSDGCWGLALPDDPEARLTLLGERCAQGLSPLLDAKRGDTVSRGNDSAGNTVRAVPLPRLSPGACLRAAVSSREGLRASLVGPSGEVLARDDEGSAFAVVPPKGPICPAVVEGLSLKLEGDGAASARLQVWASAR